MKYFILKIQNEDEHNDYKFYDYKDLNGKSIVIIYFSTLKMLWIARSLICDMYIHFDNLDDAINHVNSFLEENGYKSLPNKLNNLL